MYLAFALLHLNIVRWEQIMRKANSGIRRQLTGTKKQINYNFSQFTDSILLLKYWRMVHF